jgi:uncharacterized protein
MIDLPRNKKLFLEFCANMNPGPLTHEERREFQGYFEYFLKSAHEGDTARQYDVAIKFLEGFWVETDYKQAAYWFTKAANNGHVDAREALAGLYCLGIGVERNAINAAQWMSLAAEGGSPSAQFDLARMFQVGTGVPKDLVKAAFWFHQVVINEKAPGLQKKSISERIGPDDSLVPENKITNSTVLPEAQYALAKAYSSGEGVPQDDREAGRWYILASHNGHSHAQCDLGLCYAEGRGVELDMRKAHAWWQEAAKQGVSQAGLNIAISYYSGDGVERDPQIALQWAMWAAKNHNLDACVLVGNILREEGINGQRDLNEAKCWYRTSAYSGDAVGQYSMGLVCWDQFQAVEDPKHKTAFLFESYHWYKLAAENGLARAKEALLEYEKNFSAELLAKAQKLESVFRQTLARESKEAGNQE